MPSILSLARGRQEAVAVRPARGCADRRRRTAEGRASNSMINFLVPAGASPREAGEELVSVVASWGVCLAAVILRASLAALLRISAVSSGAAAFSDRGRRA
jgi:hypothetical protein